MTKHFKPFVLSDIAPSIMMADAIRWERESVQQAPQQSLVVVEKIAEAQRLRAEERRELVGRVLHAVMTWLPSWRGRPAVAKLRTTR